MWNERTASNSLSLATKTIQSEETGRNIMKYYNRRLQVKISGMQVEEQENYALKAIKDKHREQKSQSFNLKS